MKKLLSMLFAVAALNGASSTVWSGHLTDFTESGFRFIQKTQKGMFEVDLTNNLTTGSYSSYDPQTQSFILKSLIIPRESFDISKSKVQGVIDELKRRGQNGEIALPVFSGKEFLTNAISVVFEPEFKDKYKHSLDLFIATLKRNHHVVIEAATINGEDGYTITLTLESNLNPFELCSTVAISSPTRICVPIGPFTGGKLYPLPEPPELFLLPESPIKP